MTNRAPVFVGLALAVALAGANANAQTALHPSQAPIAASTAAPPSSVATPWPPTTLPVPTSEWGAHRLLTELGCDQDLMALITRLFFHPVTFIVIVLALTVMAFAVDLKLARQHLQLNLGNRVLAVSLLLAVFQWHTSMEQDAMQRY